VAKALLVMPLISTLIYNLWESAAKGLWFLGITLEIDDLKAGRGGPGG